MRFGLIGPGKHGSRYLMRRNGGDAFVRCYSRSREVHVPEPGTIRMPNMVLTLDAFFGPGLDGVVVATPPSSHKELCLRAIEAGIPVLCEKPLALTWEDCSAIIDAAEASKVPLLVGHTHLFAEAFERLCETPRIASVSMGGPTGDHGYAKLLDWGPHVVSMAIAINGFKRPTGSSIWPYERNARITLRWDDGEVFLWVLGERHISVSEIAGADVYTGQEPASQTPMARMLGVFEKLILGGSDPRASYDFARDVYRVLLCPSP